MQRERSQKIRRFLKHTCECVALSTGDALKWVTLVNNGFCVPSTRVAYPKGRIT